MSSHSLKSKSRHPETTGIRRELFQVAHVTFEIVDHPEHGATFALIAGLAANAKDRRPLFSGHIEDGMGKELRKLAHRIDELEPRAAQAGG
ncbi:hypothetical protein SAMN06265173_15413 [Thalassovita litoralis]|uniref:Uncharacterized protein n=1 Tax=Thalassovita litoralis TaxID=1010611 RepID=A0A521FVA2_9RHOB|nr:hypothetical protein [Thalassovita litoralis]SMO99461.1 hypothetical protein SAMN06265173_15413 [Thalassovita litoralis]